MILRCLSRTFFIFFCHLNRFLSRLWEILRISSLGGLGGQPARKEPSFRMALDPLFSPSKPLGGPARRAGGEALGVRGRSPTGARRARKKVSAIRRDELPAMRALYGESGAPMAQSGPLAASPRAATAATFCLLGESRGGNFPRL